MRAVNYHLIAGLPRGKALRIVMALAAGLTVAAVGVYVIVSTQASAYLAGQEAETGFLTPPAIELDDSAASDGRVVRFGMPGRVVAVSTSAQLTEALDSAQPGDVITLADGTYQGRFNSTKSGTAEQPITVTGSRNAILDGGAQDSGYTFSLGSKNSTDTVSHWRLSGFAVTGGSKGIIFDNVQHSVIDGLLVQESGQEAIHLRDFSSDNVIKNSTITKTGQVTQGYGEGIYIGSAVSNWPEDSQGQPDHSNNNRIIGNSISSTGAENIDIKEGTHGGLIQGNQLNGAGMCPRQTETCNSADSLLDMKGAGWRVAGNTGSNVHAVWQDGGAGNDAFQVHVVADTGDEASGQNNIFEDNKLSDVDGYGFYIQSTAAGTVARCSNAVTDAGKGFGNVACQN